MLFNSPIFLFLFLPILLLVYYFTPKKLKNLLLLLASLAFYTFGEKELVLIIIASTLIDFTTGIIIENGRKKTGLTISILANLGFLIYFKYANFAFENYYAVLDYFQINSLTIKNLPNITLPLGISFFTFQTMSYTIDVYRNNVKANRNIIDFATYVTLFPQLIAGPIVRYKDIHEQLTNRIHNRSQFIIGIERFIIGLAKKVLIANNVAFLADGIFNTPAEYISTPIAWLGVIAYAIQIYYDFSGYSDMAIGLGKMFGFDFLENFNFPYSAKSIREFWQKWHISLSNWFRDYVYISLGGSRLGNLITYRNLIIVFLITGLWHGASWNYIVWGLIHGSFIIIERLGFDKILLKLGKVFSHLYTLLVVLIAWVFFRLENLLDAFQYFKQLISFKSIENVDFVSFYLTKETIVALLIGIVLSFPFLNKKRKETTSLLKYAFLFVLFFLCLHYIAVDTYNPFIYFRF